MVDFYGEYLSLLSFWELCSLLLKVQWHHGNVRKALSMLDEVIEGFVVLVIFCVIMANDASTVIGWVTTPLMWLINLIKTFFREVLGIPL